MRTILRGASLGFALLSMSALTACSVASSPAVPTAPATNSAAENSGPPIDEPAGETPGPINYPPDNMWAFLSTTPDLAPYAVSLADAVRASEVVGIGRYVGVERGEAHGVPGQEGTSWSAVALVAPEVIAKGAPQLTEEGLIRVPFILRIGGSDYPEKEFRDLERSLPSDPALLFLYSWATYFETTGTVVPERLAALNNNGVYRAIGGDGFIRVVGGRLDPPKYMEAWPRELAGADAAETVNIIRQLAAAGR